MNMMTKSTTVALELDEQTLELSSSGAVYWRDSKTLMVADLHLGKTTTFRRNGIPIPSGATAGTVAKLSREIQRFQPRRLMILGDLVHAQCSWDKELERELESLVSLFNTGNFLLIEGNHDRGSRDKFAKFGIQVIPPPLVENPFVFLHDELKDRDACQNGKGYFIAGHVHPCVHMGATAGQRLRLKCFHLSKKCLTLPAFGDFTGAMAIRRGAGDQVFVIADGEVLKIA